MSFEDVALLSFRGIIRITFHKDCGRHHVLRTDTCHKSGVWGEPGGRLPVKYIHSNKLPFLCQSNVMEIVGKK